MLGKETSDEEVMEGYETSISLASNDVVDAFTVALLFLFVPLPRATSPPPVASNSSASDSVVGTNIAVKAAPLFLLHPCPTPEIGHVAAGQQEGLLECVCQVLDATLALRAPGCLPWHPRSSGL
jgi:hypothetical protein